MSKRLLLVAVNYNSHQETLQFVKSLAVLEALSEIQVLIVENSKMELRDKSLESVLKSYIPDLLFVETPDNKNYFGSVNFALKELKLDPGGFDFFVIKMIPLV